jgi:hypothetical protein
VCLVSGFSQMDSAALADRVFVEVKAMSSEE